MRHGSEASAARRRRAVAPDWTLVFLLIMLATGYVSIAASQMSLGLALLALLHRWTVRHRPPPRLGIETAAALLAGWALVMIPFSTDTAQSALYYRRFYLFTALWVAAAAASSERRRWLMLWFLLAGALVTCLHDQALLLIRTGGLFRQRLEGNFNAMTSGALIMMAVLTAAGFLLAPGCPRRRRLLLAVALGPLLLALVMIMTRSAQMGVAAGAAALLLTVRPRWFAAFALVAVIVAAAYLAVGDNLPRTGPLARLHPDYVLHDKNTTLRLEMWRGGWAMVKRHPITGVGDRGLEEISPRYYTSADGLYFGHLHSNIPHLAAIWGVPGLVLGQGFLLACLWRLRRRWQAVSAQSGGAAAAPATAGWVLAGIAVWAGFWVAGLTDWYFGDAEPMLIYLAIQGAALARSEAGGDATSAS
ncbi:MAG: O-antigen ligase family protein [bacterium]|nr:O-antigen ligase family protein [bacterium]